MKKLLKTTCTRFAAATAVVVSLAVSGVAMADPHTEALEKRLQIMEEQMRMMQDEVARVREEAQQPSAKVLELEEWVAKVNKIGPLGEKNNMIFFRGGFARNDTDRTGDILTDANTDGSGGAQGPIAALGGTRGLTGNNPNGDAEGWYFGAGIEHSLTDDLFGLWDDTELFGEIMFEYKEFDQEDLNRAPLGTAANDSVNAAGETALGLGAIVPVCASNAVSPTGTSGLIVSNGGPYGDCRNSVHVTQFTLTAAPKIKFMKGSKFRPWIIPAGFAFHVISPPSDGVTVNTVGVMFGAGAEYNLWDSIYVGLDARYHLTDNALDGVDIDGLTAGGYVGFGF